MPHHLSLLSVKAKSKRYRANLEMIFTIDDGPPINVSRPARPTKPAVIITVFQQENLTPGEHTLTLQNGRDDEGVYNTTVTFLDAIIYTSTNELLGISEPNNDTNNSNSSSSNTATTIAAAVSVSAFAVVFALVGLWAWRRRQHRQRIAPLESPSVSTPFMTTFPPPPTPFPPPSSSGSDSDWQSTRPTLSKQTIHTSTSSYAPSQPEQSTLNRPVSTIYEEESRSISGRGTQDGSVSTPEQLEMGRIGTSRSPKVSSPSAPAAEERPPPPYQA
ncbi:hypothetical protein ONZ45_g12016 [Pleurotus djamor]|nr:hypothetical protein ONZ45_g12016 [Pleurotus djamor]